LLLLRSIFRRFFVIAAIDAGRPFHKTVASENDSSAVVFQERAALLFNFKA